MRCRHIQIMTEHMTTRLDHGPHCPGRSDSTRASNPVLLTPPSSSCTTASAATCSCCRWSLLQRALVDPTLHRPCASRASCPPPSAQQPSAPAWDPASCTIPHPPSTGQSPPYCFTVRSPLHVGHIHALRTGWAMRPIDLCILTRHPSHSPLQTPPSSAASL